MRVDRPARVAVSMLLFVATLAAAPPAAGGDGDPPGCIGSGVGIDLVPLVLGAPPPDGIVQAGDIVEYVVTLTQPLPTGCNYFGGQLSVTLPDGTTVEVAGFGGPTPDVPVIGFGPPGPFQINVPDLYVVTPEDAQRGVLIARRDYGPTPAQPDQEAGTVLSIPPTPANSASIQFPLLLQSDPPGCIGSGVGIDLVPLVAGEFPEGGIVQAGDVVEFIVTLTQPLPTGCHYFGGQLSLTMPDGVVVQLAGFAGTPDVPVIGFGPPGPFVISSEVLYVVSADDVDGGVLFARADYGPTPAQPEQLPGTVLSEPPTPANSATIVFPLEFGAGCGSGDCCEPNGTPGCDDSSCCDVVCGADPFCCRIDWDGPCADLARNLCDTEPPAILECQPEVILEADAQCLAVVPVLLDQVVAVDDCTPPELLELIQIPPPGTLLPLGSHKILVIVTDQAGNEEACASQIQVIDVEPPQISCPFPIQLEAFDECSAVLPDFTGELEASDNCGVAGVEQVPPPGTPLPVGFHLIEFVAFDGGGNVTVCIVPVEVVDTLPPEIVCPQAVTVECVEDVPAPDLGLVLCVDNCAPEDLLLEHVGDQPFGICPITILRTYRCTDGSGNAAECVQTITVDDTTPPVVTCPDNIVVECLDDVPPPNPDDVLRIDNCTPIGDLVVEHLGDILTGTCPIVISRTYRCTDLCGNFAECLQEIVVEDTTPPAVTAPPDVTIECDVPPNPRVTGFASCTDTCDPSPTVAFFDSISGDVPVTILRTWTCIDECGNLNEAVQTITLVDTTPPEILGCPADFVVPAGPECLGVVPDVTEFVTVLDNCSDPGNVFVDQIPPPGSLLEAGSHLLFIIAFDESGNQSACAAELLIIDEEPPVILVCPRDVAIPLDENCVAFVPDFASQVVAEDECTDFLQMIQIPPPGSPITGGGPELVEILVLDEFGNGASCQILVFALDETPPLIKTCPTDLVLFARGDCADALPDMSVGLDAFDACGQVVIAQEPPPGTLLEPGTFPIAFTVTDDSGNESVCSSLVTVVDAEPPVIEVCPPKSFVEADGTCIGRAPFLEDQVIVTDNCSAVMILQQPPPGAPLPLGLSEIEILAIDSAGNVAQCVTLVEVFDTLPPVILACAPTVVLPARDCAAVMPDLRSTVVAEDNCSAARDLQLVQIPAPGEIIPAGTTAVTILVIDEFKNTSSCETSVLVQENEAPTISCPVGLLVECEGPDGTFLSFDVTATDDCDRDPVINCFEIDGGGNIVGVLDPAGELYDVGVTLVLCQATDASGNVGSCLFPIFVLDSAPPTVECPAAIAFKADPECQLELPDLSSEILADDVCAGADLDIVQDPPAGTIVGLGDVTVTFVVTDPEGNAVGCQTVVTVEPGSCVPAPGDVNGDGLVNVFDLIDVLLAWGPCSGDCPADIDGDGEVGVSDLLLVILNWTGGGGSPAQYAGPTDVGGPMPIFLNDGTVAPAESEGLVEFDGDYIQTALGVLHVELAGTVPVEEHDLVVVSGLAALAGELSVSFVDGYVPAPGERFVLLVAESVAGEFQTLMLPELADGRRLHVEYGPDAVILSAGADRAPARELDDVEPCVDLDGDDDCDVGDLIMLLGDWGVHRSPADLNLDGVVDGLDAMILLESW